VAKDVFKMLSTSSFCFWF